MSCHIGLRDLTGGCGTFGKAGFLTSLLRSLLTLSKWAESDSRLRGDICAGTGSVVVCPEFGLCDGLAALFCRVTLPENAPGFVSCTRASTRASRERVLGACVAPLCVRGEPVEGLFRGMVRLLAGTSERAGLVAAPVPGALEVFDGVVSGGVVAEGTFSDADIVDVDVLVGNVSDGLVAVMFVRSAPGFNAFGSESLLTDAEFCIFKLMD